MTLNMTLSPLQDLDGRAPGAGDGPRHQRRLAGVPVRPRRRGYEVAFLLATRLGARAEVRFLGDLASGALTPLAVEPGDWLRIAELGRPSR